MKKNILTTFCLLFLLLGNISAQSPGAHLFDNSYIHEIKIISLYESLGDTLSNNYVMSFGFGQIQTRKIPYAPALIIIDGTTLDTIGIRHKGFNSWWSSVKKPIKIDINKYTDQKYDGLAKFNLHNGSGDPSFLRENLSYHALSALGVAAPRTAFTKLYLDDEYLGLYRLVEQVDNTYLDVNFGDHKGNLYAQQSTGSGGFGLDWISENQEDYYPFLELENHESTNDWSVLIHFFDVLNHATDEQFKTQINSVFNVNEYLKILAFDVAVNNYDWYGNSGRNYYLAEIDGKVQWLAWDYNLSWRENTAAVNIEPDDYPLLVRRILNVPEFYEQYLQHFCDLNDLFTSDEFTEYIESEAAKIDELLKVDPYMDYDYEAFQANIYQAWNDYPGLTSFATQRGSEMAETLQNLGMSCGLVTEIPDNFDDLKLFPVPANQYLHVEYLIQPKVDYHIIDSSGKIVQKGKTNSTTAIDISLLNPGFYIFRVMEPNGSTAKGFVIRR